MTPLTPLEQRLLEESRKNETVGLIGRLVVFCGGWAAGIGAVLHALGIVDHFRGFENDLGWHIFASIGLAVVAFACRSIYKGSV